MTENEAIEELKENLELPFGSNISDEASRMAMKALEEIQQYHKIGSVEAITEVVKFLSPVGDDTIIGDLDTLYKYKRIGTVEECREARERQRGKKPKVLNKGKVLSQGEMFVSNAFKCPNCGIKQIYFDGLPKYCDNCGQKLKEA